MAEDVISKRAKRRARGKGLEGIGDDATTLGLADMMPTAKTADATIAAPPSLAQRWQNCRR
jgi:hypothetical protein